MANNGNVTNQFRKRIKELLDELAERDKLFAVSYRKETKNLNDCIKYILNKVQASKRQAFTNEEIVGLAMHYYDEDNIKVGSMPRIKKIVVDVPSTREKPEPRKPSLRRYTIDARRGVTEGKTDTGTGSMPLYDRK